jgi:hypothetical protein
LCWLVLVLWGLLLGFGLFVVCLLFLLWWGCVWCVWGGVCWGVLGVCVFVGG